MMDKQQKIAHAHMLFSDPVFHEIMDDLEAQAMDLAVCAEITDNARQAAALGEVRAIRNLRARIKALIESEERPKPKAIA